MDCLQWMNLERAKVASEKIMRLPIGIWDKSLWGKGYGSEVVQVLMAYAFDELEIDRFCPVDVAIDNIRSQTLWRFAIILSELNGTAHDSYITLAPKSCN